MTERPARILIVDDDDDFVAAVLAFLTREGYDVRRARNAREGLALAALVQPDLILMDVIMEERTAGFFAIQQLRRMTGLEAVPIFVLSSIYDVESFTIGPDASWLAHDEFFRKPVDLPALAARIAQRVHQVSA
ncbi:MAG TPA: response regulator [Longimicrobiales bacterium]|nr:response regulator [Longimicrobiales bacterium]